MESYVSAAGIVKVIAGCAPRASPWKAISTALGVPVGTCRGAVEPLEGVQ
jgi:hypothetical protein